MLKSRAILSNSNTTLVKVKYNYLLNINHLKVIQIQHLLKLNLDKMHSLLKHTKYSNTTLVKVKYTKTIQKGAFSSNSNTTLVKVKSWAVALIFEPSLNSNTTLVKVKFKSPQELNKKLWFKYNTC